MALVGRIRRPTPAEAALRDNMFRPNAVLEVVRLLPDDIGDLERSVAEMLDGIRPLARVRKKLSIGSADLRLVLSELADRGLLRLCGLVEKAGERDLSDETETDHTVQRAGDEDVIPPHVMAEIQAMIDDELRLRAVEEGSADFGYDEVTLEHGKLKR